MNTAKTHPANLETPSLRLWLFTNLLGAVFYLGILISTNTLSGLSAKLTIATIILFFSATLSVIIVPLSSWLFGRIFLYQKSQRMILSCLAILLLWLVPTAAIGVVLTNFIMDFISILWMATPQLAAAYITAALVYRRWLFASEIS